MRPCVPSPRSSRQLLPNAAPPRTSPPPLPLRRHPPCQSSPHFHFPLSRLRKPFRIRLYSAPRLALVLPRFLQRALLLQSRSFFLDSHSSSCPGRTFPLLAPRTARGCSTACRLFRFLFFHFLLPRLGRYLFLRQPFFRFAHFSFHSRPRRFLRSRRAALPFPARRPCRRTRPSCRHLSLERRPDVPVGLASYPCARPRFFFRNRPQSLFRRAHPALPRFLTLFFHAQSPHPPAPGPGPPATRNNSPATTTPPGYHYGHTRQTP